LVDISLTQIRFLLGGGSGVRPKGKRLREGTWRPVSSRSSSQNATEQETPSFGGERRETGEARKPKKTVKKNMQRSPVRNCEKKRQEHDVRFLAVEISTGGRTSARKNKSGETLRPETNISTTKEGYTRVKEIGGTRQHVVSGKLKTSGRFKKDSQLIVSGYAN